MNFDELAARNAKRYDARIFKDKSPRSLDDLKALLRELDPKLSHDQSVVLSTQMAEDGVPTDVQAVATIKSKRSMLLFGFEKIKSITTQVRDEVLETYLPTVTPSDVGLHWLDQLLTRWFGATREGMYIVWHLKDGTFKYDIFNHKLTKG
jgi:hypothetical protein